VVYEASLDCLATEPCDRMPGKHDVGFSFVIHHLGPTWGALVERGLRFASPGDLTSGNPP